VTIIKYRPIRYPSVCKRVLVSGGSEGELVYWHCRSGKELLRNIEEGN